MVASLNVPNAFRPPPYKRRRTATGVLAGDFDWEPRDVLTSFLRGIDYHDPSLRHRSGQKSSSHSNQKSRRKARRVEDENKLEQGSLKEKGKQKEVVQRGEVSLLDLIPSSISRGGAPQQGFINHRTASFWGGNSSRPESARSVTPTPPPPDLSPRHSTPDPSTSSTSRGSSKRPRTPEPQTPIDAAVDLVQEAPPVKVRKKRAAAKKGWKGWCPLEEGETHTSDKLINLDSANVMKDRRLRSGKNFDAISVGRESWVDG